MEKINTKEIDSKRKLNYVQESDDLDDQNVEKNEIEKVNEEENDSDSNNEDREESFQQENNDFPNNDDNKEDESEKNEDTQKNQFNQEDSNNNNNKKLKNLDQREQALEKNISSDSRVRKFFLFEKNYDDVLDEQKNDFYTSREYDLEKLKVILKPHLTANSGVSGIKNLGNTCYISTIIQSLVQCLDLLLYILSKDYEKDINSKSPFKGKIATGLFQLIETAWLSRPEINSEYVSLNISNYRQTVQSLCSLFSTTNQQDPHEFFLYLLDGLNSDLSKGVVLSETEKKLNFNNYKSLLAPKYDDESDYSASKRFWIEHKQLNKSIITELFSGQIKKTVICPECVDHTTTFEHFNTLELAIPNCAIVHFNLVLEKGKGKIIQIPVKVSDAALFFDAEKYINEFLKTKIRKFRYLFSNQTSQRLIKSSENVVSVSKKGNIFCYEVNEDLVGEDYYPLLLFIIYKINVTQFDERQELQVENAQNNAEIELNSGEKDTEKLKTQDETTKVSADETTSSNKNVDINKEEKVYNYNVKGNKNNKDNKNVKDNKKDAKGKNKETKNKKNEKEEKGIDYEKEKEKKLKKELYLEKQKEKEKENEKKKNTKNTNNNNMSFEYLTHSRLIPINPFSTIGELKLVIFLFVIQYLDESKAFCEKELIEICNFEDKDDPEYWVLVRKTLNKFKQECYKAYGQLPFSIYLSNEKEVLSHTKINSSNNEKPNNNEGIISYDIFSSYSEKQNVSDSDKNNSEKDEKRHKFSFKDDQLCEEIVKVLKNGIKLYLEIHPQVSKTNNEVDNIKLLKDNLNKVVAITPVENAEKEIVTIYDCINHYQLMEKMDKQNELFCETCHKKQQVFIKHELFYMPRNLIITLKRYKSELFAKKTRLSKLDAMVKFPVDSLIINSQIPSTFELYSVAQHSGSMEGGHYFTNIKNKGKWFGIDDNSVYPSDKEGVVMPESYMLFYRRKIEGK